MKNITNWNFGIAVVLVLIFSDIKVLKGQELDPKVVPPSPNAASILHMEIIMLVYILVRSVLLFRFMN